MLLLNDCIAAKTALDHNYQAAAPSNTIPEHCSLAKRIIKSGAPAKRGLPTQLHSTHEEKGEGVES